MVPLLNVGRPLFRDTQKGIHQLVELPLNRRTCHSMEWGGDLVIKTVTIIVEIPKGSRNKYEYDKEKGIIKFDRTLFSAVHYPCDYGFITDTLAKDGDPLDALVLVWEPTFPGCLIDAKPVGAFKMWDEKGPDEKILCVPIRDPVWNFVETLEDVPPHLLKEIEHFFSIYKELEEKVTGVEGWVDKAQALEIIEDARNRYTESGDGRP